jgi:hypothetical protein
LNDATPNSVPGFATSSDVARLAEKPRTLARSSPNDPVAANYNQPTVALGFPTYLDEIQKALEEGGAELLGAPLFTGDKQTIKPLQKCHGAVGLGQTLVVSGALKSAVKCQSKIDKKAQSFGPIASCLTGSGSAGSKAAAKIGKSWGSLSGETVGTRPALPTALLGCRGHGLSVSRPSYGGPMTCGDGIMIRRKPAMMEIPSTPTNARTPASFQRAVTTSSARRGVRRAERRRRR